MKEEKISIFWFRRDLRLEDNHGLWRALSSNSPVLPIFIFDDNITAELDKADPRITFIYDQLTHISKTLVGKSSQLYCKQGDPLEIWKSIIEEFNIDTVYANEDYEPYAIQRDKNIAQLLAQSNIQFNLHKDQVVYAKDDILKADGSPYTVFTPYKNKWLSQFELKGFNKYPSEVGTNFLNLNNQFPSIAELGFERSTIEVLDYTLDELDTYEETRNYPSLNQTSHLSPHLRFGTVSIRQIISQMDGNVIFLSELIWREFFMQILYHFPKVVNSNFKNKYDHIQWRNNPEEFEKWTKGETGYPIVDAGMRELNATGYMHNRVRMIVAGFLCKHLLIDWQWGEAYFASKLLDYELSSNNGNWQWAAGTGCDAAPYFRIFNPYEQVKKFDSKMTYIKKWVPELNQLHYPMPIVDHKQARERAISTYKKGLALTNH
ncbi:cryptochrome/photolyase family protein [Reichenbachiella agariperforans]|uniref:cryptochrome/photolyase family protein n=1 Tax=Reichenbachiella agariperforans TaxID=156994 RepID=UPI001C0985E7|nr:deoxyribodipyrimidine photo-lyase [Reichenbachiella agariperforans]MBU2912366.1 DNA photolyase family protein [Reichenbachiella agariperforans]